MAGPGRIQGLTLCERPGLGSGSAARGESVGLRGPVSSSYFTGGPPLDDLARPRVILPAGISSREVAFGNRPGIGNVGPGCGPVGMPFALGCPVLLDRILARLAYARGCAQAALIPLVGEREPEALSPPLGLMVGRSAVDKCATCGEPGT